eukprot:2360771-Prymnesium_polylepis.1
MRGRRLRLRETADAFRWSHTRPGDRAFSFTAMLLQVHAAIHAKLSTSSPFLFIVVGLNVRRQAPRLMAPAGSARIVEELRDKYGFRRV